MNAETIIGVVEGVTKKWATQRKAEERHASAARRRPTVFRCSDRVTIREVAGRVMRQAYLKASSNGTLPAHARQIMYTARGPIQEETGELLNDQYFCQRLLPDYLREHPTETAKWDVVFDARGHFTEPHTRHVVPLGTLEVRRYLHEISGHSVSSAVEVRLGQKQYPTKGPTGRFGAVLFIEKEGFMPLFKRVRLAERYDLAIMSTKGQSVTASRQLVDTLCRDIPLLVLRDFDKSGFSIAGTLQRDTRRYAFRNQTQVIDLGLRLADVEANDLESEDVHYGKSDPTPNLLKNGASRDEIAFLCGGGDRRSGYVGSRVELNAFASGDLVAWIERKLAENGIKKVVPDDDTLHQAFRLAAERAHVRRLVRRKRKAIRARVKDMNIPDDLADRVCKILAERQDASWDAVVAALAEEEVHP
jgi:hypothetical protein